MVVAPIGSFLTLFDTNLEAAMAAGITGLTAYMALPVKTSIAIYYLIRGIKIAQGDGGPVQTFVTDLFKNVVVLWFCSNAATYNQWVTNIFFTGLPAALNKAVLSQTGANVNLAGGVSGTAAAFDQVWDLMNVQVANVYQHADFLDVSSKLAAQFCGLTGGLALVILALVYLLSRVVLAVVIELGVVAIACLIFEATKPIFERWMGKVIALVFLQVAAIVVLQIVITADQQFLKQITAASHSGDAASELQGLISMVVLFFMGAFAVYSLPAIAYSIGTGVSVSFAPLALLALRGRGGQAPAGAPQLGFAPPPPPPPPALSLGLPSSSRGGGLLGAVPHVPPPLSLPGY